MCRFGAQILLSVIDEAVVEFGTRASAVVVAVSWVQYPVGLYNEVGTLGREVVGRVAQCNAGGRSVVRSVDQSGVGDAAAARTVWLVVSALQQCRTVTGHRQPTVLSR